MTETQPSSAPSRFELPARTASGVIMGAGMVGAVVLGGVAFLAVVSVAAIAALREWHRLINIGRFARETVFTGLAMAAAAALADMGAGIGPPLVAVAAGALLAGISAALRRQPFFWPIPWHAFGAPYIGMTVLSLVILRDEPRGAALVGGLLVAVWTADTGALIFGRAIGGPKLAPDLSPNKTWAGFLGGTLAAAAAETLYIFLLGGSPAMAALFGVILGLAAHAGDLFESWVKRQFHAKNTGSLIPGHGGMLDRIDSLLVAAPVCAALIYYGGLNPLTGAGP